MTNLAKKLSINDIFQSVVFKNSEIDNEIYDEIDDEIWNNILKEYKYDSISYMKNKLQFDDDLIKNIIDYYNETLTSYLLTNSSNISEYRNKLSLIIKDKILINDEGSYLFKDKSNVETKSLIKNSYKMNIKGVMNYLKLSYMEDLLLDKLYNETTDHNKIKNALHKSNFSFSTPDYLKSFFNDNINKVENYNPLFYIKFIDFYEKVVYKNTVYFIGIAEYENIKFPIKLVCSKGESGLNLVLSKLKNGPTMIRIIDSTSFLFYENLNGSQFFVVKSGWIIES
jgi:hypothetical protein